MTRRHRLARGDEGTTLVEMVITMLLISIIGLAVVGTITTAGRSTDAAQDRISSTNRVQEIEQRITKYVRAAHESSTSPVTAFTLADGNHITFYTDFGDATGPRRVDIALTGASTTTGKLTETDTLADAGSSYTYTGASTTRVLGPLDVDTTAAPIFTFYDPNGNVLATPMTTAAATSQISRVRITISTNEAGLAKSVSYDTLVYLRNVEYK